MDGLREHGVDVWFSLGDRDLAIGIERARALADGERPTTAQTRIAAALGVRASVLPMSDMPVRTRVMAGDRWLGLQEFLIRRRGEGAVQDVDFRHAGSAPPTPEVLGALAGARAIVIGPSNPVISIGPILALPGLAQAIRESPAPVVAVSPLVRGEVLKGPTAEFMRWAGQQLTSDGIAQTYAGLIDGLVADERARDVPTLETDIMLGDPDARRRVAGETLRFALGLTR